MKLNLEKLTYQFIQKPLLIGGMAMEYYGLRKSGDDIDLMATEVDIANLIKLYPDRIKDLWGDLGVCPFEFEIWRTMSLFDYDYFRVGALDEGSFLVISKEKLLVMKALAMEKEKYLKDAQLIVKSIIEQQSQLYKKEANCNQALLKGVENINYIEKLGPGKQT